MPKPLVRSVGVGPANVGVKLGDTFKTQASDSWKVGEELETWSGLVVRVTAREDARPLLGAWPYSYTLEVVGGVKTRPTADDPTSGYDPDCPACLRGRPHTREQHDEKVRRARGASRA